MRRPRGDSSILDGGAPALVTLGAIAAITGCAALPPCPARGGPAWTELTSEHFAVRTDLDAATAHDVVTELEETRAAMLGAVWPDASGPPDRIQVIALAADSELSEFTGPQVGGVWTHRPPFPATMITGGYFQTDRHILLHHELAHHLSRWFLPQQPSWFSEGIATFLETIHYDHEHQRAVVGEPSTERFRFLRAMGMYPARRLLTETHADAEDMAQFEATSWLLVHYLINHRDRHFEQLQRRLGAFEPPQDAWAAELGDLDADHLSVALGDYAVSGNYTVLHIPVPPWSGPIQTRAMSDVEVHGARAFMYAVTTELRKTTNVDPSRAEVAEALRVDPAGTPEALALRYYRELGNAQSAERRALAQRAADTHPQAALTWLMMADSAPPGDAKRSALVRAMALAPNDAEVLARMAQLEAVGGRWDKAVVFSRKAIRLRATSAQALSVHVASLANTGQCREAALYVATLRAPLAAHWPELRERCQRIAAGRGGEPVDDDHRADRGTDQDHAPADSN